MKIRNARSAERMIGHMPRSLMHVSKRFIDNFLLFIKGLVFLIYAWRIFLLFRVSPNIW